MVHPDSTIVERALAAGFTFIKPLKIADTGHDLVKAGSKGNDKTRPSWRQSEIDVGKEYPGYRDQVSFKEGNEVSHGTKNSSRPDFYIDGHSLEVKNYIM